MCHNIENGVTGNNLPEESELKSAEGNLSDLSLITLKNGSTLILKDNREIWVPKSERQRIVDLCHETHLAFESMHHQLQTWKVFSSFHDRKFYQGKFPQKCVIRNIKTI